MGTEMGFVMGQLYYCYGEMGVAHTVGDFLCIAKDIYSLRNGFRNGVRSGAIFKSIMRFS